AGDRVPEAQSALGAAVGIDPLSMVPVAIASLLSTRNQDSPLIVHGADNSAVAVGHVFVRASGALGPVVVGPEGA
ncbi:hypothetical protein, partial [Streptomyces formicae]|uniref:hypothetical protein n=1 Tax=Streptomyces formicae TaxID=1616117 RepID=UPI00360BB6C7